MVNIYNYLWIGKSNVVYPFKINSLRVFVWLDNPIRLFPAWHIHIQCMKTGKRKKLYTYRFS